MRDAGVLWLQLTGGEPTVDSLFGATYARAFDLGMMIEVLTNGDRRNKTSDVVMRAVRFDHYGGREVLYIAEIENLRRLPGRCWLK
jgi:hypothetical protein